MAALYSLQDHFGEDYDFAFDPDPTKIDWGLARRTQATNFARIHQNAITLTDEQKVLLEMADVAAYALAQSRLSTVATGNRKLTKFRGLRTLMNMNTVEFKYIPQ